MRLQGSSKLEINMLMHGIHEVIFYESSTGAVDEWIYWMEKLFRRSQDKDAVYILIDFGTVPDMTMDYIFREAKRLRQKYSDEPRLSVAILMPSSRLAPLVETLTQLIDPHSLARCFGRRERQDAIRWLASIQRH